MSKDLSRIAENVRRNLTLDDLPEIDDLVFVMLNELHANVPEVDRPLSLSDLSDEQAHRARRAVNAVLVRSMLSKPVSHARSLAALAGEAGTAAPCFTVAVHEHATAKPKRPYWILIVAVSLSVAVVSALWIVGAVL